MTNFLKSQKHKQLDASKAIAVYCDPTIESIAAAFALAYLMKISKELEKSDKYFNLEHIIPIIIGKQEDVLNDRLIMYYLHMHGIDVENIVFS